VGVQFYRHLIFTGRPLVVSKYWTQSIGPSLAALFWNAAWQWRSDYSALRPAVFGDMGYYHFIFGAVRALKYGTSGRRVDAID
jgi:hypothetical protein